MIIKIPYMWNLDMALDFIRHAQGLALMENFNLALAGGVLDHGHSDKDLDIVCLPRSRKNADRKSFMQEMITLLELRGARDVLIRDLESEGWSEPALDGRVVWAMEYKINNENGNNSIQRIDWIFVDYD